VGASPGEPGGFLLDYLKTLLGTLAADSERLADPDLVRKIPAGQLAITYGTLFDRTLRVLELAPAFVGSEVLQEAEGKDN
jgi:hypothetical protein